MSSLSLAKIYLKTGQVITLPFRSANTTCQSSCATHPSSQLIRWISRNFAAQPGFVVNIKSILFRVDATCPNCFEQLAVFLNKYRLARQTRVITLENSTQKPCSCGCGGGDLEITLKGKKPLNDKQKIKARNDARGQYYTTRSLDEKKTTDQLSFNNLQVNHRVPLEHIHLSKTLRKKPNRNNLQSIPAPVHAYVSKVWNGFTPTNATNVRNYAKAVDALMKAQNQTQVQLALQNLNKLNPNIDITSHQKQLLDGSGKSIFWTTDFLQRNPQWNTSTVKAFGKELELMMQEMYQQEFAF